MLEVNVVNAPVDGVVAPTVPLKADAVIVLLLNASEPAKVASVPVVGSVSDVLAVAVNVCVNAPAWVTLPAIVMVFAPLFTPVPPFVPAMTPVMPTVTDASALVIAMFVPAVSVAAFHSEFVASYTSNAPAAGVVVICTSCS